MISELLKESIITQLDLHFNRAVQVVSIRAVSGGDINRAFRLETSAGMIFMKLNDARKYPQMFEKEALGLKLLESSGEIRIPKVINAAEADHESYLLLEWVSSAQPKSSFWEQFGRKLAAMHQHFGPAFGLDHDNYIGSLHQYNTQHSDWASFFVAERLEPQIRLAVDSGKIGASDISMFDQLFVKLPTIFSVEKPSLLHGDLWNGNFMVDDKGEACLIDPSVYYGHREMDLGMTKLFGGFADDFYQAYNESYPLHPGWELRLDICNLYPLMVHVNLFGGGYLGSVRAILKRFN